MPYPCISINIRPTQSLHAPQQQQGRLPPKSQQGNLKIWGPNNINKNMTFYILLQLLIRELDVNLMLIIHAPNVKSVLRKK
jgi:hypothetical protein